MSVETPRKADDGTRILSLSRRLAALHAAGVVLLILVVVSTVLWVSAEHNALARTSSERLVRGGIDALRARLYTLVRDYSIWDDAFRAASSGDRAWLYDNIGNASAEIGTLDLIEFVPPHSAPPFGWRAGTPPEGQDHLLPAPLLGRILGELDHGGAPDRPTTLLAEFEGAPWAFSLARVRPIEGPPAGVPPADLPRQIHGQRLSPERLRQIGDDLLIEGLGFADHARSGQAEIVLADEANRPIATVVWTPPQPGISILRRIALPLGLALATLTVFSMISARSAVRAAKRLERALYDATAADRSKSEFLSNVSHELRTPMNGILGVAQLLRTTELDEEQTELLEILFTSANVQMALISDLLDLSRVENGNRKLARAPFEPAAILRDLVEMMRVAAANKGIAIETDFAPLAGLVLLGDGRAFRQIATNLMGNAVKFTDRGKVTVRATTTVDPDGADLVLEIRDTGRGIPPDALPHIFERFYQADGSNTRISEGTGLGLAISQALARMMGGRISATSEYGTGTIFVYTARFETAEAAGDRDAA